MAGPGCMIEFDNSLHDDSDIHNTENKQHQVGEDEEEEKNNNEDSNGGNDNKSDKDDDENG